ncbi:MAG TPA: nucleotide exchange factor GrpE [Rectinemataceae bacterium]|nr:nucleotide exchange factor GrpE [Rectinemataceae bacterium]
MSNKHHESRDSHNEQNSDKAQAKAPENEELSRSPVVDMPSSDGAGATEPAVGEGKTAVPKEAEPEARIKALSAELAKVREELSSVNDKYLRKLADDVNFRKRMAREKEDTLRFAVVTLLGDLIPILDDFDRAIASAETARDYAILHDGIVLIRRQLGGMLENKYGLKRFESLGKPFDPNHHEAVAMISGEGDEATVAEEFLPGYGLHERILRTAKVKVMMPGVRQEESVARTEDGEDTSGTATAPTDIEQ